MLKRLVIVGLSTVVLAACGGASTSNMSVEGVRAAAIQLVKNVNAKKWEAVRAEMTPRYYRSFVGVGPGALRYVLPRPADRPSLTPADISAAEVSVDGNRADMSLSFASGYVVFVYAGGRWLLDGVAP